MSEPYSNYTMIKFEEEEKIRYNKSPRIQMLKHKLSAIAWQSIIIGAYTIISMCLSALQRRETEKHRKNCECRPFHSLLTFMSNKQFPDALHEPQKLILAIISWYQNDISMFDF